MASPNPSAHVPISTRNTIDDSARIPSPIGNPQPGTASGDANINPRVSFIGEPSFQRPITRTIASGSNRVTRDEEAFLDKPPIPSVLPAAGGTDAAYSTPLPVLPLIVLSITMLSEFLSATVCIPFLLFMVQGFLAHDKEADVGYWTGVLVSTFSLTQFLTSLLWATVAERHGERTVLFVSLLGTSLTCVAFGTSTSLPEALTFRLMQGIFAGSIGVARSSIVNITDGSNEGRAYAILGFCWGFGGSAGAIIGGTLESPAKKWPNVFGNIPLFVRFPYLFPCFTAASITLIGAILSLFLATDGGSRESAIYLPTVEEETEPTEETRRDEVGGGELIPDDIASVSSRATFTRLRENASKRFSGLFSTRGVTDANLESSGSGDLVPFPSSIPITSRSRANRATGSAYSHGGHRTRLPSTATTLQRGSIYSTLRRRRGTFGESVGTDGIGTPHEPSNLAQRLLMANENAVTNISDLWVAAAISVDYDEVFMSDDEEGLEGSFSDDELESGETPQNGREILRTFTASSVASRTPLNSRRAATLESATSRRNLLEMHRALNAESVHSPSPVPGRRASGQYSTPTHARLSSLPPGLRYSHHEALYAAGSQPRSRISRSLSSSSQLPSIFANAGVRAPPGLLVDPPAQLQAAGEREDPFVDGPLDTIPEGHAHSEKPQSAFRQLPLMIILQYGLMALHSTTNDQIFLSYLVSKYDAGGLGLTAAHFSQLIALMCLAQIVYQFYLYPYMGPPRGCFSHLAMFRLGSLLFIPAYISLIFYRVYASKTEDGNFILMTLLAISTAIRYCALTFTYTAISILLNYMSPPHVVGLANGLAQSIVCLARFVGPVLGGAIWSMSIKDNPGGYPLGFYICSVVCALAILHSFIIR